MASSNIEWTDATWNPVTGCTRVSAGCDHCYAVGMTARLEGMSKSAAGNANQRDVLGKKYAGLTVLNRKGERHFNGKVRTHDDALPIPLGWKKPARIFVNSMSDLFHKDVPFDFIDKVFAVMALCPQHTFQILTKRADRMAKYFSFEDDRGDVFSRISWQAGLLAESVGRPDDFAGMPWPLPNVWLGASVENQPAANKRIPQLLSVPAAVRFLSCEPLLGPVHIDEILVPFGDDGGQAVICPLTGEWAPSEPPPVSGVLHWVITGGESGPGARPCNVEYIRAVRDQCRDAGVPLFIKQLGALPYADKGGKSFIENLDTRDRKGGDWDEWPADLRVREFPEVSVRNA